MIYNLYFQVYKNDQILDNVHIISHMDIWNMIVNCPELCTKEKVDEFHNDSYNFIYNQDFKELLLRVYPQFRVETSCDLNDPEIKVRMMTITDYRQYDEKFNNELSFIEYIQSEQASVDKKLIITEQILKDNGFEEVTMSEMKQYHLDTYGQTNYSEWRLWTTDNINDEHCLKLDIDNGFNNRGTNWHLHIDNNVCSTIGSADINTVWEFNTLMEVFGSKFRIR